VLRGARDEREVPRRDLEDDQALTEALVAALRGGGVVALTGAGVSTESGIPDYRSPEAAQKPRKSIQGPEFARSSAVRQRYWARAMVGWERFRDARPNPAHAALAALEAAGVVTGLVTQNVDRLHHAAGSREVVELHGALAEVFCLACGAVEGREPLQARMHAENRWWRDAPVRAAPDGDADLDPEWLERFVVPACTACGGVLKPKVVFFGDSVARPVVDRAYALVDSAKVLLVAGTSLAVFSGYRFLRRAHEKSIPIVIVNRGAVRGEEHAALKIEASTGAVLASAAERLTSGGGT
jgi:NAD-dependent SIR2 family protein deacetylase